MASKPTRGADRSACGRLRTPPIRRSDRTGIQRENPPETGVNMAFSVPDLPYSFDALEPYIDAQTMEIHHDKHHAAYVANANAALEGTEWADKSVEEILTNLSALPADKQGPVRNNAGGHYNHSLFWE